MLVLLPLYPAHRAAPVAFRSIRYFWQNRNYLGNRVFLIMIKKSLFLVSVREGMHQRAYSLFDMLWQIRPDLYDFY